MEQNKIKCKKDRLHGFGLQTKLVAVYRNFLKGLFGTKKGAIITNILKPFSNNVIFLFKVEINPGSYSNLID